MNYLAPFSDLFAMDDLFPPLCPCYDFCLPSTFFRQATCLTDLGCNFGVLL